MQLHSEGRLSGTLSGASVGLSGTVPALDFENHVTSGGFTKTLPQEASKDFNDFVVMIESVHQVPTPAPLALLSVSLIGIAMIRRKRIA